MYQPYDPFVLYQPYNDPQPEHYASGIPQGMPQPSRPSAFASTEPPFSPYYGSSNNSFESQPYGSQPYGSQTPNYYPANPTTAEAQYPPSYASTQYPQPSPSLSHTGSHHYPPPSSSAPPSHTSSHHYPPPDFYPSVSSGGYSSSHSEAPVENSWAPSYPPRKDQVQQQEERVQTHAVPIRDEKKENISFSVDEAQAIIKHLKETNKNLTLQLTNSRDSTNKVILEKDAAIEQLQKEIEAARNLQAQAVDPKEAVAAVEREWTQRFATKEQEILAQTRTDAEAMAEKLAKSEAENAALLARVSKLQSDEDSGRAFLLATNSALEAELGHLREDAKQQESEIRRLKDESEKQEAEAEKLRDENIKLLDDITQMVDEKDNAVLSIKQLEVEKGNAVLSIKQLEDEKDNAALSIKQLEDEKRELEARLAQLKDHSDGFMAESNAIAAEKSDLLRRIDSLEQELQESRDLCEDRKSRIECLENEELPTLNSQLDLMAKLDEEARHQIAELEEKLENTGHAVDDLERQLDHAQKREMEIGLVAAGQSRSAAEEIQKLRVELDEHLRGKSETAKSVSELEAEKTIFEQRVERAEDERREAVERVAALEKSLKEVAEAKDTLEVELGLIRETMDREAEENDESQTELRSKIVNLEEQVSALSSAKSTLETRLSESEAKVHETERLLHATEDMLKVLNEDVEQKRGLETTVEAAKSLKERNVLLEDHLATSEAKNAQLLDQIAEWTKKAQALEREKSDLCYKINSLEKAIELAEEDLRLRDLELVSKKRLERELKGLKLELGKENSEMDRLKHEVEELKTLMHDAKGMIFDLEGNRAKMEARTAALLEDKKKAAVRASELGEDIRKLETENKELNNRFSDMNTKYLEIVADRDALEEKNRNLLRNK